MTAGREGGRRQWKQTIAKWMKADRGGEVVWLKAKQRRFIANLPRVFKSFVTNIGFDSNWLEILVQIDSRDFVCVHKFVLCVCWGISRRWGRMGKGGKSEPVRWTLYDYKSKALKLFDKQLHFHYAVFSLCIRFFSSLGFSISFLHLFGSSDGIYTWFFMPSRHLSTCKLFGPPSLFLLSHTHAHSFAIISLFHAYPTSSVWFVIFSFRRLSDY